MKPEEQLKRLLDGARISTRSESDSRLLEEASAYLPSPRKGPNLVLAVAAFLLVGVGLLILLLPVPEPASVDPIEGRPPIRVPTLNSLLAAFDQGGMEALEEQLDRAGAVFGTRHAGQPEDIWQTIETLDL